jgi:spoIIIJ-associated protein
MELPQAPSAILSRLLEPILHFAALDLTYTCTPGPPLTVVFTGPGVPHLLARNAELLLALEHLATQALRLQPDQHDQVSFDAGNFKATRQQALERSAHLTVLEVRRTRRPYHFPPMNSRERRLLHLALTPSGLPTQSEGEGPQRHLVLHPKD